MFFHLSFSFALHQVPILKRTNVCHTRKIWWKLLFWFSFGKTGNKITIFVRFCLGNILTKLKTFSFSRQSILSFLIGYVFRCHFCITKWSWTKVSRKKKIEQTFFRSFHEIENSKRWRRQVDTFSPFAHSEVVQPFNCIESTNYTLTCTDFPLASIWDLSSLNNRASCERVTFCLWNAIERMSQSTDDDDDENNSRRWRQVKDKWTRTKWKMWNC